MHAVSTTAYVSHCEQARMYVYKKSAILCSFFPFHLLSHRLYTTLHFLPSPQSLFSCSDSTPSTSSFETQWGSHTTKAQHPPSLACTNGRASRPFSTLIKVSFVILYALFSSVHCFILFSLFSFSALSFVRQAKRR